MIHSRIILIAGLICPLLIVGKSLAAAESSETTSKITRRLENSRMQILAVVQADPHNQLAAFTTDGCSGGLSDGWRLLAKMLPGFERKFGNKPPYESCCIQHDRVYWHGETRQGYEIRKQADIALRQCVLEFGNTHRDEFAQQFHLPANIIENNFRVVAALMYRAVRVGGMPCTGLPWRWGYGWPQCREQDD